MKDAIREEMIVVMILIAAVGILGLGLVWYASLHYGAVFSGPAAGMADTGPFITESVPH